MPFDLTLVHTEETTVLPRHTPPSYDLSPERKISYGQELRSRYPNEWPATYDAYDTWDLDDGGHRADHLESCRSYAWFAIHKQTGAVRVISSACHLRWCPLCAEARAAYLAASVRTWYKSVKHPKLLTLTLKHSDACLTCQINHLYQSFRRLRLSSLFRRNVTGGIWFFQIKWNKQTHTWHPHIHALIAGQYVPQKRIKQLWLKITSNSEVVDIRSCWSPESAARHVARYATRPGTLSSVPPAQRTEFMRTLHGRRIVGAWGSARGIPLKPPPAEDKDDWTFFGTWNEVHDKSHTNLNAKAVLLAWHTNLTVTPDLQLELMEPFKPDQPWLKDAQGNQYYNHSIFTEPVYG